jgi:hypothetical protein
MRTTPPVTVIAVFLLLRCLSAACSTDNRPLPLPRSVSYADKANSMEKLSTTRSSATSKGYA